jgi:hypothetical protein
MRLTGKDPTGQSAPDLMPLSLIGHSEAIGIAEKNNPVISIADRQKQVQEIAAAEQKQLEDWFNQTD